MVFNIYQSTLVTRPTSIWDGGTESHPVHQGARLLCTKPTDIESHWDILLATVIKLGWQIMRSHPCNTSLLYFTLGTYYSHPNLTEPAHSGDPRLFAQVTQWHVCKALKLQNLTARANTAHWPLSHENLRRWIFPDFLLNASPIICMEILGFSLIFFLHILSDSHVT